MNLDIIWIMISVVPISIAIFMLKAIRDERAYLKQLDLEKARIQKTIREPYTKFVQQQNKQSSLPIPPINMATRPSKYMWN